MSIRYAKGQHNDAAGTRDAFAALSDDLEAEGLPPFTVNSGDREPAEQVELFVSRFWQQAIGVGRFADVRYWDGSAWGYGGGTRWVRWSDEGTVAVPGTGNHEKHRSNDLAWPYDSDTWQHARARELAKRHNITCDGIGFGEWWHWTFWGALGVIGAPASTDAEKFPATTKSEEDTMARLIKFDEGILPNDPTFLIAPGFLYCHNDAEEQRVDKYLYDTGVKSLGALDFYRALRTHGLHGAAGVWGSDPSTWSLPAPGKAYVEAPGTKG